MKDIGKLDRGKVVPHWTSSHGKQQLDWGPPNVGMGDKWLWRSLNDMVDRGAKAATKSQALKHGLEERIRECKKATRGATRRLRAVEMGVRNLDQQLNDPRYTVWLRDWDAPL